MKEVRFAQLRKRRWEQLQNILDKKTQSNNDELVNLYTELTDDLSYAKTYYPGSQTVIYLNQLAGKAHEIIHSQVNKEKGRVRKFIKFGYPLHFIKFQKEIGISLLILLLSAIIGWYSAIFDDSFVRLVLGDDYVDMTLSNISNNDPMAVYKSMNSTTMTLGIALNNIWVSFLALLMGLLTPVGTAVIIFRNGIMLGAFLAFFNQHALTNTASLTIAIHGVPEIFAIIVAGGAGIVLGKGLVYPGIISRMESFQIAAKNAIKIVAGLIPVFIYAAILEGFVTRNTQFSDFAKFLIISFSIIAITFYFYIYPIFIIKKKY